MGQELRKATFRRLHSPLFHSIFRGSLLDIGAGEDGFSLYRHMWPNVTSVREWQHSDGDGMTLEGIAPQTFSVVHSSHSLEHMADPLKAMERWIDVTQVGGHIVLCVPDFEMYEKETWPSRNGEHQSAFSMQQRHFTRDDVPLYYAPVFFSGLRNACVIRLERIEFSYDWAQDDIDQTCFSHGAAECAIEVVLRRT